MPQMMPINWIFSLILFIMIFISFMIMNYFIFNYKFNYNKKMLKINNKNLFLWKW